MSKKAEFYRSLAFLVGRAANGDRQAELALDELVTLVTNVRNAVAVGDRSHVEDLLTDATARAYLRQAFG